MWGFTRTEQRAILFLLVTFGVGSAIVWYRRNLPPPPVELALLDSLQVHASHIPSATTRSATNDSARLFLKKNKGSINVNTATLAELIELPGVGEVLAQRILDYRAQHGKFKRVDDLEKVNGLGKRKVQAMKARVVVE